MKFLLSAVSALVISSSLMAADGSHGDAGAKGQAGPTGQPTTTVAAPAPTESVIARYNRFVEDACSKTQGVAKPTR
ncbi:hypothetical protein K2X33_07520 [bacterium]|nr:hypothetical protein [bacterium]